jgi:ammonia channel protein AmtB
MLLLGFLANVQVNPALTATCKIDGQVVALVGGLPQFVNQLKGVVFTGIFAGGATFILLKIVNGLMGLRVSEDEETVGLDQTQHGENAYNS